MYPCRLESITWAEDKSCLVARIQRFLPNTVVYPDSGMAHDGHPGLAGVWEVTNDGQDVELTSLKGVCDVVRSNTGPGAEASIAMPRFSCLGFVEKKEDGSFQPVSSPHPAREGLLPWRREGFERLYYDRRAPDNHWNGDQERRVLLAAAHVFTDAFNFRNQVNTRCASLVCFSNHSRECLSFVPHLVCQTFKFVDVASLTSISLVRCHYCRSYQEYVIRNGEDATTTTCSA